MNFFQELALIAEGLDLTMRIKVKDGKLTVAVFPDSLENVQPIVATGTAEEMDAGFIDAVRRPLTETKQMLVNSADFISSVQESLKSKEAAVKKATAAKATPASAIKDDEEPEDDDDEEKVTKPKPAAPKKAIPAAKKDDDGPQQMTIS